MKRIFVPTTGPDDWKRLLAEPDKQWKAGFSAKSLAWRWEEADAFPSEVEALFSGSEITRFRKIELIMAFPEHRVPLPGGARPSQSDLFVLAKDARGELVALTVEGKASEPFGPSLQEWTRNSSTGREERLGFILKTLGLSDAPPMVRYQLVHRMASAVIEADRFRARSAIMIIHSFSQENRWFEDFKAFVALFEKSAEIGHLCMLREVRGVNLLAGWAEGWKPGS